MFNLALELPTAVADAKVGSHKFAQQIAKGQLRELRPSLHGLTGTRFFAAFYVVLFHFASNPAAQYGAPVLVVRFLSNGFMGVPFFFLLSGFILTYSYLGQVETHNQRRRFWEARFARVYPVYLLSLVLNWPFRNDGKYHIVLSKGAMAATLTATQTWNPIKPYLAEAWNFPAWTLSVEAFFYLCFPFLLPALRRLSRRWQTAALFGLFAVVVSFHTSFPVGQVGDGSVDSGFIHWIPIPVARLPEFMIGILLALRFMQNQRKGSSARIGLYLFVAIVLLSYVQGPWLSLLVLPFAGLIYELASGESIVARYLSSPSLRFLGGASYSIYLLQFPVRNWIRLITASVLHIKGAVGALASPVILIALSCVVYQYYEEPLRRVLKRLFATLERSKKSVIAKTAL